jgi:hypothetical protein
MGGLDMAVLVIGELQGGDAALDARMMQELGLQNPAPGAIARFAGPTEKGWRVITVWESEDAYRAFERDRLQAMFDRLGVSPPTAQVFPLDSVRIAPTAATQGTR